MSEVQPAVATAFFDSPLQEPQAAVPALRPRSARRRSHVDMTVGPDGVVLSAECSDTIVDSRGAVSSRSDESLCADLAPGHLLRSLELGDGTGAEVSLAGVRVGGGFRGRLAAAFPNVFAGPPLYTLLDELPVAALISGYTTLYTTRMPSTPTGMIDICSGWRSEGLMMTAIRERGGQMPVPVGPVAPDWTDVDAWPAMRPLVAGEMRRSRLIDVGADGAVYATFRDEHCDPLGVARVLHEYSLAAAFEGETGLLNDVVATARVLPWHECPHAARSAQRLSGTPAADLRQRIASDFRGTSTCTHLNDLLRTLADVPWLWSQLAA